MVSVIPKHIAGFTIGVDRALWRTYKDESSPDTQWSGWALVGGIWVEDPVTIKRVDGEVNILMFDTNHNLNHSTFNFLLGHNLTPWKNLGGPILGSPAVANSKGTIHIFHIGTDHALYHNAYDGSIYTPSKRLGGMFLHSPAAISNGEKDVSVFAVGLADGCLSHYHWTGSTEWAPPTRLPGIWAGTPSVVPDQEGFYDVFGIDGSGKINHVSWRNGTHSLETINGRLRTIDAVSWGPGRIDLIGWGFDYGVYHMGMEGNSWSQEAWEGLGGLQVKFRPTPVSHSPGALTVIGVGWNTFTHVKVRDPTTGVWGTWTNIGGNVMSRVT